MPMTKEEAACSIYGLEVTTENIKQCLKSLESVGLVPVNLVNGDPAVAFAIGTKKSRMEPWRYKEFNSSSKRTEIEEKESESSLEVSVPQSNRAVLDLAKLIMPQQPITGITDKIFLTEVAVFEIVKTYFCDLSFRADQLNDWMGKDGSWGVTKQKRLGNERVRGREINVVKKELRGFTWEDISNIKEFRKVVRTTSPTTVTIGYIRKSNIKTEKAAVEKSINLQAKKLILKCLCESVFASCKSNAYDIIYDRDTKKNNYCLNNIKGDCQDLIDFISMSTKYIRLVVIDYAGFSTNPDDIRSFFNDHKQLKELVVDEGHTVSCFSKHDILNNDAIIEKFRCRKACKKRSVGI